MARIPDRSRLEQHLALRDHLSSPDPEHRALAEGFLEFLDSYQAQLPRGLISDTRPKFMTRPELAPGYQYVAVPVPQMWVGDRVFAFTDVIPNEVAKRVPSSGSDFGDIAGNVLKAGAALALVPEIVEPVVTRPVLAVIEGGAEAATEVGIASGVGALTLAALMANPFASKPFNPELQPMLPRTEPMPPLWVHIPVKVGTNAVEGPQTPVLDEWTRLALEEYFSLTGKKSLSSEAEAQIFRDYLRAYLKRSGLPEVLIPDEMFFVPAEAASTPQKTTGHVQMVASTEEPGSPAQPADAAAGPSSSNANDPDSEMAAIEAQIQEWQTAADEAAVEDVAGVFRRIEAEMRGVWRSIVKLIDGTPDTSSTDSPPQPLSWANALGGGMRSIIAILETLKSRDPTPIHLIFHHDFSGKIATVGIFLYSLEDDSGMLVRLREFASTRHEAASLYNVRFVLLIAECRLGLGGVSTKIIGVSPSMVIRNHDNQTRMQEVIWNLLRNAGQHRREGQEMVTVTVQLNGNRLIFGDNGAGMTPETLAHLRHGIRIHDGVPVDSGNHGLGMMSVRKKCEEMGIVLEIDSTLGEGSTFTLTLPEGFLLPPEN